MLNNLIPLLSKAGNPPTHSFEPSPAYQISWNVQIVSEIICDGHAQTD